MKKSVLLHRVFLVVIMTLVLAFVLTGAIYVLTSRVMFAGIKAREMLPKARSLGRLIERRMDGAQESVDMLLRLLQKDDSLLGGSFIVLDADGELIAASDNVTDEMLASMNGVAAQTLTGEEIATYSAMPFTRLQQVCVSACS